MGKYKHYHMDDDLQRVHWLDVMKRIGIKLALVAHEAIVGKAPTYLQELLQYTHHGHTLKLIVPYAHPLQVSALSVLLYFSTVGPRIYNNLLDWIF
jgi:hypothetical protein